MRLEDYLAKIFKDKGWHWKVKNKGSKVPSSEEIEDALDEAARLLYTEPVGTQLEVGRLIIKKLHHGHDVYIYAGAYE